MVHLSPHAAHILPPNGTPTNDNAARFLGNVRRFCFFSATFYAKAPHFCAKVGGFRRKVPNFFLFLAQMADGSAQGR